MEHLYTIQYGGLNSPSVTLRDLSNNNYISPSTSQTYNGLPRYTYTGLVSGKTYRASTVNGGPGNPANIYYVLNGDIQNQPVSIQFFDNVKDTPLRNYSLLEVEAATGVYNGDIVSQGSNVDAYSSTKSVQKMEQGEKYYWEITPYKGDNSGKIEPFAGLFGSTSGSVRYKYSQLYLRYGDVIGFAADVTKQSLYAFVNGIQVDASPFVDTLIGDVYAYFQFYGSGAPRTAANFGQQVFQGSNASYDESTGSVVLSDTSDNKSKVWSVPGWAAIFDGNLTTRNSINGTASPTIISQTAIEIKDSVKIYSNDAIIPSILYFDGTACPVTAPPNNSYEWRDVDISALTLPGTFNETKLEWPFGSSTNGYGGIMVDGRVLVDGPINDNRIWSDNLNAPNGWYGSNTQADKAFDNNTGTYAETAQTDQQLILDFSPRLEYVDKVEVLCKQESVTVSVDSANPVSVTKDIYSTVASGGGSINRIVFQGNNGRYVALSAIKVDGLVLVDGGSPAGTYKTLFKTWSQQLSTFYKVQIAAADALVTTLQDHAQTYSAGEDYCEGSVIKAFGELWIAINDAPSTTFADLPAIMSHPNWERLGITV